jgi:hypothetical protein
MILLKAVTKALNSSLTCHHKIPQLKYEGAWDGKMPGLLHGGGLNMLFKDRAKTKGVAVFSYAPNDSLAQMIVDAWVDDDFRKQLTGRKADGSATDDARESARISLAARGIYLKSAVVITEDEYDNDYILDDADEVAFVLPNQTRVTPRSGQSLLDTARLLMAATPNGI